MAGREQRDYEPLIVVDESVIIDIQPANTDP